MAEVMSWPWPMIGAGIAALVLFVALWVNFVRPSVRRWQLKRPCKAYFHIRELEIGTLNYVAQDDRAHNVTELVLPSNSVVEIEIAYDPIINFHVEETVFGVDGDLNSKPVPEERHTRFISEGKGKTRWVPGEDDSDSVDRWNNYHFKSRIAKRSVGSCYTTGFKLKTRSSGLYKCWLGFLTDEVDGGAMLSIRVEDKPRSRMKCVSHRGCYVRPQWKVGSV